MITDTNISSLTSDSDDTEIKAYVVSIDMIEVPHCI